MKLRDLLLHNPDPGIQDINLLRTGRHFRFSDSCKIVVGRNHEENRQIRGLATADNYLMQVENCGSPITLLAGDTSREAFELAASITARYCDAKQLPEVEVTIFGHEGDTKVRLKVRPMADDVLERYRV